MAFELFTKKNKKKTPKKPTVTILKQGIFSFNSGCVAIFQEKNITFLQLLYDRDTKKIGFKPCRKNSPGAFPLRITKTAGQVSGTSFLKNYEIPFRDGSKKYEAQWDEAEKMLVIQLD